MAFTQQKVDRSRGKAKVADQSQNWVTVQGQFYQPHPSNLPLLLGMLAKFLICF